MSNLKRAERVILIREAEERRQKPNVGYLVRHLTRCHFPMTKPPADLMHWERRDGNRVLAMLLGNDPRILRLAPGLPYGSDLIALYGLCTKGREQYRQLKGEWDGTVSFRSTAEMLRYFGDPPTKQYYGRRMKSLLRLLNTELRIYETKDRQGNAVRRLIDKASLIRTLDAWFDLEDRQIGMPFENVIRFSSDMVEWIRQAPAFEDEKVFVLRQTIGALQLYLLLRDRCAQIDLIEKMHGWIPVHGPNSLESQIGWIQVPQGREVRRQLVHWLTVIRTTVWPECPGEIYQGGDGYWRLKIWYVPPLFMPPMLPFRPVEKGRE